MKLGEAKEFLALSRDQITEIGVQIGAPPRVIPQDDESYARGVLVWAAHNKKLGDLVARTEVAVLANKVRARGG